jgi:tetratricopeptide (TPR) repeat protein
MSRLPGVAAVLDGLWRLDRMGPLAGVLGLVLVAFGGLPSTNEPIPGPVQAVATVDAGAGLGPVVLSWKEERAGKAFPEVAAALDRGDWAGALVHLNSKTTSSARGSALVLEAAALVGLGNGEEALKRLDQPEVEKSTAALGLKVPALYQARQYMSAYQQTFVALGADPDYRYGPGFHLRARLAEKLVGDRRGARMDFLRALDSDPALAESWRELARLERDLGRENLAARMDAIAAGAALPAGNQR